MARVLAQSVEAVDLFEQAIALLQKFGVTPPSMLRWQHATSLLSQGDIELSASLHEENLADALAGGDTWAAAAVLCDLATIALFRGDLDLAGARLGDALVLAGELREVFITEYVVECLAAIAHAKGRPRQVAHLLGAADRLCARCGLPSPGSAFAQQRRTHPPGMDPAHLINAARVVLGEPVFAAAWKTGQTAHLEQVIADAFDAPSADMRAEGGGLPDRLTPREAEVLRQVAKGMSNREIARDLVLSIRTVERHITNLYTKIGARGKADATAYAFRHDLT